MGVIILAGLYLCAFGLTYRGHVLVNSVPARVSIWKKRFEEYMYSDYCTKFIFEVYRDMVSRSPIQFGDFSPYNRAKLEEAFHVKFAKFTEDYAKLPWRTAAIHLHGIDEISYIVNIVCDWMLEYHKTPNWTDATLASARAIKLERSLAQLCPEIGTTTLLHLINAATPVCIMAESLARGRVKARV